MSNQEYDKRIGWDLKAKLTWGFFIIFYAIKNEIKSVLKKRG